MKKEEEIVTKAMLRTVDLGSNIHVFCFTSMLAFHQHFQNLNKEMNPEAIEHFALLYKTQKDLRDKFPTFEGFLAHTHELLKQRTLDGHLAISDCASFTFAFSNLDGVADEMLDITKTLDRPYWEKRIGEKKVGYGEIQNEGIEAITTRLIDTAVIEAKGKYLKNKISVLMEICRPSKDCDIPDYKLDLAKIGELNGERNRIVHEVTKFKRIENVLDKIVYMNFSANYLVKCVKARFAMGVNINGLLDYLKSKGK